MVKKTFIINGVTRNILVDENETLATFLRERLLLTGCKIGCGEEHSRYLIELSFLSPPAGGWTWGRGTAAPSGCCGHWAMKRKAST